MSVENTDHALFVQSEYRYAPAKNPGVQALNDGAAEISIDTSLNEAAAQALANKILAENEHPRIFSMDVEDFVWLDFFIDGPPQWHTVLEHDAVDEPLKGISTSIDFNEGYSVIEVRG
ncbi:hypothetical protein [Sphingobium limneticum]|uniref:Uncharacterized protein n=1 Tax=Sphingobium limneticum TaxID=1007511 RepID=A0A5J5I636_9SPHN|nr:hypothetical protein [Sphingobium limneticum]KAA9018304.1 hypothetical protein F4U96_09335 [Sphingobium limneticum]KAA9030939.1 hypothetical protein F4U95_09280 [Sphingobium limneticum]